MTKKTYINGKRHMFMYHETQYLKDVIDPEMNLQNVCNSSQDLNVVFYGTYHTA